MHVVEDSSPRNTLSKLSLRLGLATAVIATSCGVSALPAQAASLSTLQKQAAAASAQAAAARAKADAAAQQVAAAKAASAQSASRVAAAASQVDAAQGQVSSAGVELSASEQKLANAQRTVLETRQQLQQARDYDAQLASELAAAQDALADAKGAVAAGQAQLETQQSLMGSAAREAFQQQSSIEGLATIFGSQTPSDLSQRLQWSDTIFDTQAAEKARLDLYQTQLQASRDLQIQIEARVSAAKDASAAQVRIVADLERKATEAQAAFQSLVAQNQQALQQAQAVLSANQGALGSAQGAQSAAQQQLSAAQSQLAASQAAIAEAEAEAAQTQKEIQALIAAQKAAAAASASSGSAPASGSSSGASGSVSSSGFIRPVDANPGSPFGMRFHPILHYWRLHAGTDFGAACGTPIYAARAGVVLSAGFSGGAGNRIVLGHGTINGSYVTTSYFHQSKFAVSVGQQVSRGQLIGYVGTTGLSTGCHLHLEVRHDGTPVNPMNYIP